VVDIGFVDQHHDQESIVVEDSSAPATRSKTYKSLREFIFSRKLTPFYAIAYRSRNAHCNECPLCAIPEGKPMSDGGLILLGFLLSLFGSIFVIWASLKAVKRRVTRWDNNSYTLFITSLGSFGQRQIENWKRWGGYDDDQAKLIIKYQAFCWFGMIFWILVSMAVVMGFKALTYEDGQKTQAGHQSKLL
jgi:hypothetical protein